MTPEPDADKQEAQQEPERRCRRCHEPMAADQEWCLSCGQAAPGILGRVPGMRAAGTLAALTLALSGGAVAAAYAALSDDPPKPAPAQVAQAPQTAAPPAGQAPAQPTAPVEPAPPSADGGDVGDLPDVDDIPKVDDAGDVDIPEVDDVPDVPEVDDVPTTPTKPRSTGGSGGGNKQNGSTKGTGDTSRPIAFEASAVQVYDPYQRVEFAGDVERMLDDSRGSSWPITAAGEGKMNMGVVIDLGTPRGVREVRLLTKTPGFRVEVYASDADEVPPEITDSRWAHIEDAHRAKKRERIVLGSGSSKYRWVLLWFSDPPADGRTVRITDLELRG